MKLTELVQDYSGTTDPEIEGLTQDSRRVEPGWLFAALPGSKLDGRAYIEDALRLGAAAILVPPGTSVQDNVPVIEDENPRRRLALLAAAFYKIQPRTLAAVTGTNGKTSVTDFTRQIWQGRGYKAASIGTLGVRGPGMVRSGSLTTPDPVSLHAELADLAAAGITHLAMEASSHGLDQHRLDGVRASVAAFTNLSHDHLDYHDTMEDYLAAKARLFESILQPGGTAVLNADIPEFETLAAKVGARGCKILSYGRKAKDIVLNSVTPLPHGQEIAVTVNGKSFTLTIPLVGEFQVMNALCALGMVMAESESFTEDSVAALKTLKGVPGRLQQVPGAPVYIDYAHTPDALDNILTALRPHTQGRLICIIGCGGDRDPRKRPVMGRIAAEKADFTIITDDNPRSENPAAIRKAMLEGAASVGNTVEIAGRRAAIECAVESLEQGDVLVIAGKGHERGQIIGDRVEPFDDLEEASKAMERKA